MKDKKNLVAVLIILLALLFIGVRIYQVHQYTRHKTNSLTVSKARQQPANRNKRTIVVFFSRAEQNYPDSDLKIGYTNQIANLITQKTGGQTIPDRAPENLSP